LEFHHGSFRIKSTVLDSDKDRHGIRIGIGMISGSGSALNPLLFRLEETRSMKAKMTPKREKVPKITKLKVLNENPDILCVNAKK
jgi:hypothetical protein